MDASGSSPLFDNGPLLGQDPALENSQVRCELASHQRQGCACADHSAMSSGPDPLLHAWLRVMSNLPSAALRGGARVCSPKLANAPTRPFARAAPSAHANSTAISCQAVTRAHQRLGALARGAAPANARFQTNCLQACCRESPGTATARRHLRPCLKAGFDRRLALPHLSLVPLRRPS